MCGSLCNRGESSCVCMCCVRGVRDVFRMQCKEREIEREHGYSCTIVKVLKGVPNFKKEEMISHDFQIALAIKDDILPRAIAWFTGDALEMVLTKSTR